MPKGAIANGHWYGRINAQFRDASYVELEMTRLVVIRRLSGGQGCALQGHTSLMQLDLQQVAKKIMPLKKDDLAKRYQVIIQGPLTKEQRASENRRNEFRPDVVLKLLEWRKRVNHHFKDVEISSEMIREACDGLERHIVFEEETEKKGGMKEEEEAERVWIPTRFNHRIDETARKEFG